MGRARLSREHEKIVSRFRHSCNKMFHKVMTRAMVTEAVQGPLAYQLEFPLQFLQDHAQEFHEDVILKKPDCRITKWPLRIKVGYFKSQNRKRVIAYGDGGWKTFVLQNQLKVGDLVIFNLVAVSQFIVYIFPCEDNRVNDDQDDKFEDDDDKAPNETKCPACEQSLPRCQLVPATVAPSNSRRGNSVGPMLESGEGRRVEARLLRNSRRPSLPF